jgi:hypothetical protein
LDIPLGFDDHALDAMRYAIFSNEAIKQIYKYDISE